MSQASYCGQVEYGAYHYDLGAAAAEALHCPRCSRLVTDAHGVCGYCRENAYQCRSCRNINYERRDPFQVLEAHKLDVDVRILSSRVKAVAFREALRCTSYFAGPGLGYAQGGQCRYAS